MLNQPPCGDTFQKCVTWVNQGQVISLFPFPLGGSIKRTTWGSPTELWLVTEKKTIFLLPQPGSNSAKGAWWGVTSLGLGSPLCEWGVPTGPTPESLQSPREPAREEGPGVHGDIPATLITSSTGWSLKKTKKTLCTASKAEKKGKKT